MAVLTRMIGFIVTSNPEKAKAFYSGVLGFRELSDDNFAIMFDANGTKIRVNKAQEFTPARGTVLGWEVEDIYAARRWITIRLVVNFLLASALSQLRSRRSPLLKNPAAGQAVVEGLRINQALRRFAVVPAAGSRQIEYRLASIPDRNHTSPKGWSYLQRDGQERLSATWKQIGALLRCGPAEKSFRPGTPY